LGRVHLLVALFAASACGHSEPFTTQSQTQTLPYASQEPVRLTYNPGDNYWPSWTEDGRGIIYYYSVSNPDSYADDRCIGLLRPSGGTRIWQMCDERREHADSADSFAGAAIGSDGRLIYLEISTRRGSGGLSGVNQPPQTTVLWLADTTFPFQRRPLLQLGTQVSGTFVNWLRDTQWIGPTSFIALAQFDSIRPYPRSALVDSIFIGVGVVRGEIGSSGATLSIVPGTESASSYSLAENGTSLIIWRSGLALERVPLGGGTPSTIATIPTATGRKITGLTCQGSICLVSTTMSAPPAIRFWRVSLATGVAIDIAVGVDSFPRISPTSTDVVGRNVTSTVVGSRLGSLFLYRGLLP
jgi:hypothetical protein